MSSMRRRPRRSSGMEKNRNKFACFSVSPRLCGEMCHARRIQTPFFLQIFPRAVTTGPGAVRRLVKKIKPLKSMNKSLLPFAILGLILPARLAADPALTIYNQNFAVVRDSVPLDLKEGVNDV